MNAEIINIGDELLIGQVVNTNCSYMAKVLNASGINVNYISVISDNKNDIAQSVLLALQRSDSVLITGGLGPTKDDVTKHCLNELFGGRLIEDKQVSEHVRKFFEARNLPYTDTNRSQAFVPDCCQVIFNSVGTAPGMVFNSKDCRQFNNSCGKQSIGKLVISMPGVPFEMQKMMNSVTKILLEHYKPQTIIHRTVSVSGIGESFLSDRLEEFEMYIQHLNGRQVTTDNGRIKSEGSKIESKSSNVGLDSDKNLPHYSLAYLPEAGIIKLRLSVHRGQVVQQEFDMLFNRLKEEIKEFIIGEEDQDIATVLGRELKTLGRTLATAESCTGGNIAHRITLVAGASSYFKGAVVSYCNEIKNRVLCVNQSTLDDFGAVSMQTAKEMSENVLRLYDTDYAISATGLAGPDSDGTDNEIGTVYIGIASKNGETIVKKTCYKTTRANFIDRVTNFALFELLKKIQNSDKEI